MVANHRRLSARRIPGFLVLLLALLASPLLAQEPDDRPLVPRKPATPSFPEKYRLDPTLAMFRAIDDEAPPRSEKENPDEYRAWNEVVQFARQFPVAELETVGNRVLTSEDLIQPTRRNFFLHPIRFDGLIKSIVAQDATKVLQEQGLRTTYLARLIPTGEPFRHEVLLVFSDLPEGIDSAEKLKDRWVSFAGFSFKLMTEEPDGQKTPLNEWKRIPLLIGQSVTVLPGAPVPEGDEIASIPNKNLSIFQLIKDDAPRAGSEPTAWPELAAWNWVNLYARKFPAEELEKHARKNLSLADLFEENRRQYKLDLVYFEGQLIRLQADKAPRQLQDAGVKEVYIGWLIPNNQAPGHRNPISIVFTELPEGLEPAYQMNKMVAFAGYSFKLLRYESVQKDQKGEEVWRRAPVLIGRTVRVLPEPEGYNGGTWSSFFVPAAFLVFGGILGTAGVLSWWFRRGDKKIRQELDDKQVNPFGN